MAALAEVGESVAEPERYFSVNVDGTAAVVEAAAAAGAGRLVFSSTAAVYGAPERTPIDEDDTLAPANPYGETKLAGERLLEQARSARRARRHGAPLLQRLRRRRRLRRGPRPRDAPHPAGAARRARRHADPRVRRRLPHAGRHLRARLRPRRRPRRRAHRRARGAAGRAGLVQPWHGHGRLGAGRARRRRGGHRAAPAPRDGVRGAPATRRSSSPATGARRSGAGLASAAQPHGRRRRRVGVDAASTRTGTRSAEVARPAEGRRQAAVSRRPPAREPATRA